MLSIDPFFRDINRLTQQVWDTSVGRAASWMPLDSWRDGDAFVVELDLPGIDAGSLDVSVEQDMLTVRAERPEPGDRDWLLAERPHGVFTRQLSMGKSLDADQITAEYTDGVLRLRIPVAEAAKPRKIAVVLGKQQHAISA